MVPSTRSWSWKLGLGVWMAEKGSNDASGVIRALLRVFYFSLCLLILINIFKLLNILYIMRYTIDREMEGCNDLKGLNDVSRRWSLL